MPTCASRNDSPAAVLLAVNTVSFLSLCAADPQVRHSFPTRRSSDLDAGKFTVDAATGALSFVTAPDFELPTDAGGNNIYDVTVQVSDGHGGIDKLGRADA